MDAPLSPAPAAAATGAARLLELPARTLPGGLVVHAATTARARRRGLARLDALPPGAGLHLSPCRSVHTAGMRFALDLVWLDGDGRVVRIDRGVRPWRVRSFRRARSVVEVAAGRADAFLAAGLGAR
ncbi:MAG: DUF192 domain-containing protein [Solirubrobacteraceae bacterium]|nr:DUF192 domain-containing protein [Solirubrobacteraceae bacterium]